MDFSLRYWNVFQKAGYCDMKFAISTFKYELSWDYDDIYGDLMMRPLKTFDSLFSRIDGLRMMIWLLHNWVQERKIKWQKTREFFKK